MPIVIKPFKSLNRRFAAGDKIAASDIDPASAFALDDWIARGFVAAEAPLPKGKAFGKVDAEAPPPAP